MERKKIPLDDSYWMPWPFRVFHHLFYYLIVVPLVFIWLLLVNRQSRRGGRIRRSVPKAILVSNHSLVMDPAIVNMALLPRRAAYAIKEQLMRNRLVNFLLRLLGGYPLHYRRMRELDGAVSGYLKEYGYAHFFPEGHEGWSYKNQQLNKFNTGAFFFALELEIPVLPVVVVHFATRIFGREYPKLPRRVVTVVLPPVDPAPYREAHDGLNKAASAMAEDVRNLMQGEIDRRHAARDRRWRDRAANRETG